MDTGALSIAVVWVWTEKSFLLTESLFAANTAIASLMGKISVDSHWCGDFSPTLKAKIETWDGAPGFSCKMTPTVTSARCIGSEITDGVGFIMHQKFRNKEHKEENDLLFLPMQSVFSRGCSTHVAFEVSDSERILVSLAESKEDILQLFKNYNTPEASALLGAGMGSLLDSHAISFGNTTDAHISKELAKWPMVSPAPLLCGSLGAEHIRFFQKMYFPTKANRDAFLVSLDKTTKHAALYIGFAVGETGAFIVSMSKNMAEIRELQVNLGNNTEALEALGNTVSLNTWNFGTSNAEWMTDFQGWADTYPALRWETKSVLVSNIWSQGKENYDTSSVCAVQEGVFKDAASADAMVDLHNSGAVYEGIKAAGANFSFWRTGPTHTLSFINFPSAQSWLDFQPVAQATGDFLGEAIKDYKVYAFGDVRGPGVAASFAAWNQAPWCNVEVVDINGIM